MNIVKSYMIFFFLLLPVAISLASFATYSALGNKVSSFVCTSSVCLPISALWCGCVSTKQMVQLHACMFAPLCPLCGVCAHVCCMLLFTAGGVHHFPRAGLLQCAAVPARE